MAPIGKRIIAWMTLWLAAAAILPASARAESFVWRFQNVTPHIIVVELYAKDRSQVWPGEGKVWRVPPDRVVYANSITCERSEYICFGGWSDKRPNTFWGAGRGGGRGCKTCCYHCNGSYSRIIRLNP